MIFDSLDSMFTTYQEYARLKGFSIAKRAAHKVSGEDKYVVIICDWGRKRRFEISSKRIDCSARINAIKQVNGCWVVSKIYINHNHDLNPEMPILMPRHRSLSVNMKRQLEANDIVGLRPCKNIKVFEVQAGGLENLGCLPKDCRNFIEKRRRLRLGDGDAEVIHKLFITMQLRDRNFFHLMDVDDEGRLCNVLWIHPPSKAAYEEFHDVISFDTTYLVNKYKMPFVTFVDINHHG
ncbi:protein FAR1-RELATED SEQUENCE 4-like [Zingiber officinale]|uniref:protein FAR1-RELATED SEQUENCE 4-like n=1 Tax=Zingiber officinale TaxID=94328 RepID=UPI001C4B7034|nr:protein FAR1-RELATED SEQUENCE 4-like [Zingiber officinale]